MTTFFVLLEKMKLAVEAGDFCRSPPSGDFRDCTPGSPVLQLVEEVEERMLSRVGRPSLEDMAAVFIRIASCRRMEGALRITDGVLSDGVGDLSDRDFRMGFCGVPWGPEVEVGPWSRADPLLVLCSDWGFVCSSPTLTDLSRTIWSKEGVTKGMLASSLGMGALLCRDESSLLRVSRLTRLGCLLKATPAADWFSASGGEGDRPLIGRGQGAVTGG